MFGGKRQGGVAACFCQVQLNKPAHLLMSFVLEEKTLVSIRC